MRATHLLACLGIASLAAPGLAERPRLRFDNGNSPIQVTGSLTLRVVEDPYVRPRGVRYGVSLDGDVIATSDTTPWQYAWDSSKARGGEHELRLLLIDSRSNGQVAVDQITVVVSASRSTPRPEPVRISLSGPAARPAPERRPVQQPSSLDGPQEPAREHVVIADPPPVEDSVSEPQAEPVTHGPASLPVQATALCAAGKRVYVGLAGGGVLIRDDDADTSVTVKGAAGAGRTRLIAAGEGSVWWLTAGGSSLFGYRERDGKVQTYTLPAAARSGVTSLAYWRGRVVVAGTGAVALDTANGKFVRDGGFLPSDLAEGRSDGTLYVAANEQGAVCARVSRSGSDVTLWHAGKNGRWAPAGKLDAGVPLNAAACRFAVSPERVAVVERDGVRHVRPSADAEASHADCGVSDEARAFKDVCASACAGGDVWWARGSVVFHCDTETSSLDAFMPWNSSPASVRCMAADGRAVWVATDKEVRRIVRGAPDQAAGYGGYVKVALGGDSASPASDEDMRLAAAINDWQGVPYVWGGASRSGTDCSGFVMGAFHDIGVDLPHGSSSLRSMSDGMVVKDELRYGDVLVYPGHCAIYIGNGRTAETVANQVGTRSIWMRSHVVVRRFLGEQVRATLASRGGGYNRFARSPKPKAKPAKKKAPSRRGSARR